MVKLVICKTQIIHMFATFKDHFSFDTKLIAACTHNLCLECAMLCAYQVMNLHFVHVLCKMQQQMEEKNKRHDLKVEEGSD